MEKEFTCFFTGHRKLPVGRIKEIRQILSDKIEYLIENKGVENFIAGGALGFDTIAAEAVIILKEKYPFIKLYLYLPCYDQSKLWKPEDKYRWRIIMTKVDDYEYITEDVYTKGCMQKRNYKMADDALYCISYCVISRSGTGMTMNYAGERGNIIENIADEIYS
ncbi:MAG: DUF1273 domain-containing protein [Clostridia bacterium]|nr:DUF1273 domain-containing protein [Clostridia bacterium]